MACYSGDKYHKYASDHIQCVRTPFHFSGGNWDLCCSVACSNWRKQNWLYKVPEKSFGTAWVSTTTDAPML